MNREQLARAIEKRRRELQVMVEEGSSLQSRNIIKTSRSLDMLLLEYQRKYGFRS